MTIRAYRGGELFQRSIAAKCACAFLALLLTSIGSRDASACQSDEECKGRRVCEAGKCIDPPVKKTKPKPEAAPNTETTPKAEPKEESTSAPSATSAPRKEESSGDFEFSATLGYGWRLGSGPSAYGLVGGLRAAYVWSSGIELGLRSDDFLGSISHDGGFDVKAHFELGDVEIARWYPIANSVALRGAFGLGFITAIVDVTDPKTGISASANATKFLLLPEFGIRFLASSVIVLGADFDYIIIPSSDAGAHGLALHFVFSVRPHF